MLVSRLLLNECWSLCGGGGTSNLQGGAIYAYGYGSTVTLTISNTEFKSNNAGIAVSEILSLFEEKETS